MRMMSWSRYRCLSQSFMRIRAGLRRGRIADTGHKITTAALSAPAAKGGTPCRRRHRQPATESARAWRPAPDESDPQRGCFEPKWGHAIPMSDAVTSD
jgi:hypothetical protein